MIVITTPTGNIGGQVLKKMLTTNETIRVIARDPSKVLSDAQQRVEIVRGSLDNTDIVAQAYHGADDLFFIVPPSMQYSDVDEYYLQFARITCHAIESQKIKRVVYISGTGLGYEKKAGPVSASYLVEKMLESTGTAVRVLHCGTFMENLLHSVPSILFKSQFATTVPADTACPWVATRDIANAAVQLLTDKTWNGVDSIGVLGPRDISYGEIAKVISEVVGRTISYQQIPDEALKATLLQYGATDAAAQGLIDIYTSMKNGVFNRISRTSESSSPTSIRQWCEEVLNPALNAKSSN